MLKLMKILSLLLIPTLALAGETSYNLGMTNSMMGYTALCAFVISYMLVMAEEFLHLSKSKPVLLTAGIIWILVAMIAKHVGTPEVATAAVRHNLLEYAELFLFLLVAMTYVTAMQERGVFDALRNFLVKKGFSYRALFWITGILAFFISPVADNLTTAMVMCAVAMAVGKQEPKFIPLACINIVVAANAGGAFSPFGDITTLMVWQQDLFPFNDFFHLFVPSVVNFVVPAAIMTFAVPTGRPDPVEEKCSSKTGAGIVTLMFLATIVTAVSFHNYLHLPPVVGMMMGLAYLKLYSYYLKLRDKSHKDSNEIVSFDVFNSMQRLEWDTLIFFYGIVLSVGGLATIGYLSIASEAMYGSWGASLPAIHSATPANVMVGLLSAIVDNIPVMFAVLTMQPHMSEGQWLLVTLTAGVGGSLLSFGSAAGVALMGQARGYYGFMSHLKWTWAILLGYFASIAVHFWWNKEMFNTVLFN